MFIGATGSCEDKGNIPLSGDYLIQVYQVRSSARRKEVTPNTLSLAITGGDQAFALGVHCATPVTLITCANLS